MHSILNIKTLRLEAEALNPITDYKEFITGIFWQSHFKCVSHFVTFSDIWAKLQFISDAIHQLTLSLSHSETDVKQISH